MTVGGRRHDVLTTLQHETHRLVLADGRTSTYVAYGSEGGRPVLFLHGFPGSRLLSALTADAASVRGVRVVAPDRPGCGRSSAARHGAVADWAGDAEELADHLGWDAFHVLAISGGAPFALACAARMPSRVRGVAVVSGFAPPAPGNRFRRLSTHRTVNAVRYSALLALGGRDRDRLAERLLRHAPAQDRDVLRGEPHRIVVDDFFEAFRGGVAGPARELHLLHRAWGFDNRVVDVPVDWWHGAHDRNVPVQRAASLVATLPRGRFHHLATEAHVSAWLHRRRTILDELLAGERGAR